MKRYEEFYPITFIKNVIDQNTQENLYEYLSKFNHINLGYKKDLQSAVRSVPKECRRKGTYITFYTDKECITRYYDGVEKILGDSNFDKDWDNIANWKPEFTELTNKINQVDNKVNSVDLNNITNSQKLHYLTEDVEKLQEYLPIVTDTMPISVVGYPNGKIVFVNNQNQSYSQYVVVNNKLIPIHTLWK